MALEHVFDAARLRDLKAQRGLSWQQIADRSGVGVSYLNELGSPRRDIDPSARFLVAIALALDVSPLYLLTGFEKGDEWDAGYQEGVLDCIQSLRKLRETARD